MGLWEIGLIGFLIVTNALFAGSEIALITLRPAQVDRLSLRGGGGRALARLASDPNRYLATIQIGITLAGFLASAAAAVNLADPLIPRLSMLGGAAEVVAIIIVTIVLTYLTLVLGELAPKRIALQHPEGWALTVARPLDVLASISRPAVWLLSGSTDLVVRLTGGDPRGQRGAVSEDEIRDMISTQATWTDAEKQIITGALEVGDRTLREVLVPRQRVVRLAADLDVEEALQQLLESGHSRAPVFRDNADDVIGLVALRDLIGKSGSIGGVVSSIRAFPESASVLTTLRDLQRAHQQMALVVDEFGGLDGIVTIEDLIEEIVGEIYDEYDRDVTALSRRADGTLDLPGSFPFHDLTDLGMDLPEGSYTTIAGFLLDRLGHIPSPGEHVDVEEWRLTVTKVTDTSIVRIDAVPSSD